MQNVPMGKARFVVMDDMENPRAVIVNGRVRWALEQLILAAAKGCTPVENPAPVWSIYVDILRQTHSVTIDIDWEAIDGPTLPYVPRYFLISDVKKVRGK